MGGGGGVSRQLVGSHGESAHRRIFILKENRFGLADMGTIKGGREEGSGAVLQENSDDFRRKKLSFS